MPDGDDPCGLGGILIAPDAGPWGGVCAVITRMVTVRITTLQSTGDGFDVRLIRDASLGGENGEELVVFARAETTDGFEILEG